MSARKLTGVVWTVAIVLGICLQTTRETFAEGDEASASDVEQLVSEATSVVGELADFVRTGGGVPKGLLDIINEIQGKGETYKKTQDITAAKELIDEKMKALFAEWEKYVASLPGSQQGGGGALAAAGTPPQGTGAGETPAAAGTPSQRYRCRRDTNNGWDTSTRYRCRRDTSSGGEGDASIRYTRSTTRARES